MCVIDCAVACAAMAVTPALAELDAATRQVAAMIADVPFARGLPAAVVPVEVFNFDFSADPVINVGDTVQWTWAEGFHNVTSVVGAPEAFASETGEGLTFSHTFATPGLYRYYCSVHGADTGNGTAAGMTGTVRVLAVPEPATLGLATLAGSATIRRRR